MTVDRPTRELAHARPAQEVAALLGVDPATGLTETEAERRLASYGPNRLDRARRVSILTLLLRQFRGVIVWLLAGAAALSFVVGDHAEAAAIACVLIVNTAIGFFSSLNARRSMEALFRLTSAESRVRRAGRSVMVQVPEITVGDVVLLEAGDIVPADMRLIEVADLYCDESTLTGESAPVEKNIAPLAQVTLLADRSDMVFRGTAVTRGGGVGIVCLTGAETELGRISELAQSAESRSSPLEQRLDRLGGVLVGFTVALSVLIGLIGLARGLELLDMVETAIALAVAAVPEGLPVVATLALARGMLRMARRNTLIERLSAVETLGATTIILTDKTGTLTENRMEVTAYLLADGDIATSDLAPGVPLPAPLRIALEIGALCKTAELDPEDGSGVGDPLELALLREADRLGQRPDLDPEDRPEIGKVPFDSASKMMATLHRSGEDTFVAVKGAPEAILRRCDHVIEPDATRPLTDADRARWLDRIGQTAEAGYRLIGLACRTAPGITEETAFDGLALVGFASLLDPLRPDVAPAIAECREAGVRVVMMTGDHVGTARQIATQLGLGGTGEITALTEDALAGLKFGTLDGEAADQLSRADVFARVTPETKLRLVEQFQNQGHIVAMTGDGINDAPALKQADIGVAMGKRGTQVARDAAAVVLKDDAFASIVAAMRQGRIIFGNIRRFVIYLMSCNLSEILIVGLAIAAGLPAPLVPLQILFLNIVTDVFPAFALGLGEGDDKVMQRPPRDPSEQIVGRAHWIEIIVFGGLISAATLGAFSVALMGLELPVAQAVTIAFLTLALSQLWHVFNMRGSDEGMIFNSVTRNPAVFGALALCLGLLALAFLNPVLSDVLALSPLAPRELGLAFGASLGPVLAGAAWLGIRRRTAG